MSSVEPYTKLSVEIQFPDGDVETSSIVTNAWDLNGERMGELLWRLMRGLGYAEETVCEIFSSDCDCFKECQELPAKKLSADETEEPNSEARNS